MFYKWLASIVIGFILRQIEAYSKLIDWDKVKADLDTRIRALVPGTWFDDQAVLVANAILDQAKAALADAADIEKLLTMIAAGDYAGAFTLLKDLILGSWIPKTPAEVQAAAMVELA